MVLAGIPRRRSCQRCRMEQLSLHPSLWMALPFVALLAAIALAPLFFADWWGKHYPKVCAGLAVIVVAYYLFALQGSPRVLHTATEYLSFIALIGSLFIVSGGIHINIKGEATPFTNLVFLAIGALVANVLGTTGASMLLIRPWIRMNKYRVTAHHIVFFIFIVSNVGGCLTPVGDPPLFLGYLAGVDFWWVAKHGWFIWLHCPCNLIGHVLFRGRSQLPSRAQTTPGRADPSRRVALRRAHEFIFPGRDSRRRVH